MPVCLPVCACLFVLACVCLPVCACLCVLACGCLPVRAFVLSCLDACVPVWLCAYACGYMLAIVGCSSARLGSTAAGDRRYSRPGEVHLARVICLHMLGYAALLVYTYAGCRRHVAHFVGVALR